MRRSRFLARLGWPWSVVLVVVLAACAAAPDEQARRLSSEELEQLGVDGRVSPHLPIRFSATVENELDDLELRVLHFRVGGRPFEIARRIAPGESRRVSFQWVYPEDPEWEGAGTVEVDWKLEAVDALPLASD